MNKKYLFWIGTPLAIYGIYRLFIRNREPLLDLEETDWANNIAVIKFGNNQKSVKLGNDGEMNAGSFYSPNLYKLTFNSDKKKMTFYVKDKDGNLYDKQIIDFNSKIIY
jgi:hypothetical protein